MKITHNETGSQFQLNTEAELEIERTNPFFNEWGEQSLPMDLPDTDLNRTLTGQAHLIGNKHKPNQRVSVKIEDGEYVMQARQAILGAQKNKAINTSYYMNEGAFYDSLPDSKLTDIFDGEVVENLSTVAQCIDFCTNLLSTNDERFAIFPILIDGESGSKKYVNRLSWMDSNGETGRLKLIPEYSGSPQFYNSFPRTETINGSLITVPAGFYISPFIKANYLLKRIFQHFGYSLLDNFFTQTDPFKKMVFLNKTVDTLANGKIKLSQIVPNCTCSTIINVFRKKFHCEFIPDEVTKTVQIILFKNSLSATAEIDLTNNLTDNPIIDFPESYRQIKISSEEVITDSSSSVDDFDSITDLLKDYPTSVFNKVNQSFYRTGFTLGIKSINRVSSSSVPYSDSETLKLEEISVPDCHPMMTDAPFDYASSHNVGTRTGYDFVQMLYVGKGNYLNSSIIYSGSTEEMAESPTTTDTEDQRPMLAFYYDANGSGYIHGTISNYNYLGTVKLWDYTLCYFGASGLFEQFYRGYDNLLRNSLHTVKANLLLSSLQKRSIPAHKKIIIKGQELFINSLKYRIGGVNNPEESEFFTTHLFDPVDQATDENSRYPNPLYKWQIESGYVSISKSEYDSSPYKETASTIFYPPHPTSLGGQHYYQHVARAVLINGGRDTVWRLYTYYLTAIPY